MMDYCQEHAIKYRGSFCPNCEMTEYEVYDNLADFDPKGFRESELKDLSLVE